MALPLSLEIAFTHLRSRARQTLVAVFGVATGVGFFIAIAGLMEGSQRDFVTQLVDATPHIVIKDEFRAPPVQPVERLYGAGRGAVALSGLKPKEELRGIKDAEARLASLAEMPGVRVAPILSGQAVLRYGSKEVAASLIGIEPELEARVTKIEEDLTAGSLEALHGVANGVILGTGLAKKLGAENGDTLSVSTPAGVVLTMKVVGLFRTGVVAIDNAQAYALLKKVQVLQNRPNVINQIRLKLDDVGGARSLARRIEARYGYLTESWDEANESLMEVLTVRNTIMYTVVSAILMVAGFGIFNIVSTIVHEKARDIAILKSLGFEAGAVSGIFVLEGTVLGAVGSVLGWLLGIGLLGILGAVHFEFEGFTEVTGLPLASTLSHYLISGGVAIGTAAVAAWLPARRAAGVRPVEIIRGAA